MQISLEVVAEEPSWKKAKFASKERINKIALATLESLGWIERPKKINFCLLLTHDQKMQELNFRFLGKNKPTNVLAFPRERVNSKDLLSNPPKNLELGDIAMGYQVLTKEAIEYELLIDDHFTHLVVHGILHTLGFDHEEDSDALEMYRLEDKALAQLGVKKCIRH